MRLVVFQVFVATAFYSATTSQAYERYEVLHDFKASVDGQSPVAGLTVIGNTLFGSTTAVYGGDQGFGTLFSLNKDGSQFRTLHTFNGNDGANPQGTLLAIGATLYGTAAGPYGGQPANNLGTVFELNVTGTIFNTLHSFPRTGVGGAYPTAGLTLVDSVLYGTTLSAAGPQLGSVFSMHQDGSHFQQLNGFSGNQPVSSHAGLIESSGIIYSNVANIGNYGDGIIYSMNLDGSNVQTLHTFDGSALDGSQPDYDLTMVGSRLYGVTKSGGSNDGGIIFSMNLDGSDYEILHEFTAGPIYSAGTNPSSSLVLVGSKLFGTTSRNGTFVGGSLFSINLDGSGFQVNHYFGVGANAALGAEAQGNLLLVDNTLYGVTAFGGDNSDGVVYAYQVPEPSSLILFCSMSLIVFLIRGATKLSLRLPSSSLEVPNSKVTIE